MAVSDNKRYCLHCQEWVEVEGTDDAGNEYHLVYVGLENGVRAPCAPLFEDEAAAIKHLQDRMNELLEANGEMAWALHMFQNAEPLNEVCEHGCHIDDTYGFVVMAECPEHD